MYAYVRILVLRHCCSRFASATTRLPPLLVGTWTLGLVGCPVSVRLTGGNPSYRADCSRRRALATSDCLNTAISRTLR